MVGIVTGNGLGLERSSAWVLGSNGQLGASATGRANENVLVNAATGNLIVSNTDEMLFGLGLNDNIARTYNSLGSLNDDNGDNWRESVSRKVAGLTGTVNTSGSTITRTDWDGSEVVFTWDSGRSAYVSKEGSGAFDTLTYNTGTSVWTWKDGDSRSTELYDGANGGRITSRADTDGNTLSFSYNGSGLVSRVTTTTGASVQEYTDLTYSGTDLVSLVTGRHADTAGTASLTMLTRVTYGYDGSHRLTSVTVDLSPTDNSTADGVKYVTSFTYDSTSRRIASITQTDGSSLAITYDGSNRVSTLVQTVASGVTRKTEFAYGSGTTDVRQYIDATNYYTTTLNYDSSKQLTSIVQPAPVSGGSPLSTSYTYDSDGNVLTVVPPTGKTVTYTYDSGGNRTLERDYAGNTVSRTFGSNNEVLTESHYLVPDPDGAGAGTASSPVTSNFVYDSENHLRFMVSPEGRVTEYRYDTPGNLTSTIQYASATYASTYSESALSTWVSTTLTSADKAVSKRTDSTYDFRGNLASTTSYEKTTTAGAGDTSTGQVSTINYVYDQAGNLLSRYTTISSTTYTETYTFDGLNRLKTSSDFNGASTTIAYTDASGVTAVTLANGLVQTSTYDKAGELISYAESGSGVTTATTSYRYDVLGRLRAVTDPTSLTGYLLYDRDGRKVADIAADGTIVEYIYNADSQLIASVAYKNKVSSPSSLVSGSGDLAVVELSTVRPTSDSADRWAWNVYDNAGRLIETIDAAGAAVIYAYDGDSRLTSTTAYANVIASGTVTGYKTTPPTSLATPTADSANDRVTRNFYDNDGRLVGALDAQGYLTKIFYDSAGQKTETIGYATQTSSTYWVSGTLAQLTTSAGTSSSDIHNYSLYDNRGFLRATIDGEGDLTRYGYDPLGNVTSVVSGQKVTAATSYTLATLPAASGVTLNSTTYTRSLDGQVLTEVRTLASSATETDTYTYDAMRRLLTKTTTSSVNTDTRATTNRYDLRGRLTGTVGGVGSATLPGSPTSTQIDTAIATYGTIYTYDTADRLISQTEADGSGTSGLKTLFYYDTDGRLVFSVDALGEVTEHRYDTFGEVSDVVVYGTRIGSSTVTSLQSAHTGQVISALTTAISGIANSTVDSLSHTDFHLTGTVSQVTDPLSTVTSFAYNAFRQLSSRTDTLDTSVTAVSANTYDRRGQLLTSTYDSAGLNMVTAYGYDAFGRAIQTTDANGVINTAAYDRAGRTVTTVQDSGSGKLNLTSSYTYDGRGNVLTRTVDPSGLNETTTYAYTEFNRAITVTTPEAITTSSVMNAYGQTISVTDGNGVITTFAYDKNGAQTSQVADPGTGSHLALTSSATYDSAGKLSFSLDARGVKTSYTYDAANRVLTRKVDDASGGLNLVTTYAYDAKGQQVSVTDPAGVVTTIAYDKNARQTTVVVDPGSGAHLALTRAYTYDKAGRVLTIVEASGSGVARTTQYTYDKADRLTKTQVDPSGLNLTTQYAYDKTGNVTARTDAAGKITRYVYDNANRLIYVVDAAGGVTKTDYDAEGRVTATRGYAAMVASGTLAGWGTAITVANVTGAVSTGSSDEVTAFVYDKDGRLRYTLDAYLRPTEYVYDNNGNLLHKVEYATVMVSPTYTVAYISTHLTTNAADRTTRAVYDAANRQAFSIDATGAVTAFAYDANGNAIKATRYAVLYTTSGDPSLATMASWVTTNAGSGDRVSRTLHDAAGRAVYGVDAEGFVTQQTYNADGQVTASTRYAAAYTVTDSTTISALATTIGTPTGGVTTSFTYDAAGGMTQQALDPSGLNIITAYTLNALGQVTDTVVASGSSDAVTTHYVYDAAGRVTSQAVDPSGLNIITAYTYDGMGRVLTLTLGGTLRTTNTYDALGQVLTVTTALNGSTNAVTTNQYDAFGNLTKVTDPRGYIGYFYYDALNRLYLQIDPEGYATKSEYSTGDQATKVTHYMTVTTGAAVGSPPTITANGAIDEVTTITRDKLDRVTGTTDAEGFSETYTLNAFGDRTTVVNKLAGSSTNSFDKRGLLTQEVLPISSVNSAGSTIASTVTNTYAYDARGNRTQMVEAYGLSEARTTNYVYDKADRQTTITHDAVTVTDTNLSTTVSVTPTETITYDARGNVILTTTSAGQTSGVVAKTFYYYDTADRKVRQVDALGTMTKWAYDAASNATDQWVYGDAVTLPSSPGGTPPSPVSSTNFRHTVSTYDRANRLLTVVNQGADAALLTGAWNGSSYATTTGYITVQTNVWDAGGNLIQQTDALGNSVYLFYDKVGHKVGQVDQEKYFTKWTLNGDGNVNSETRYATALTGTITAGTLPSAPSTTGDDRTTTFTYDRDGRRLTETRTGVTAYTINSSTGALTTASISATISYAYNGLGEVTRKTEATGDYVDYAYDVGGRQTSQTTSVFTDYTAASVQRRTSYSYDGLNDLTRSSIDSVAGTGAAHITQYTYGAGGRLATMTDAEAFTRTYAYDAAGRVVKESFTRYKADGTTAVTQANATRYDLLGRATYQAAATYASSTWTAGDATQLGYDVFGEVIGKGVNVSSGAYQETFSYDAGGRMWKSTAGDGAYKLMVYDAGGHATMLVGTVGADLSSVASSGLTTYTGSTPATNTVQTITLYDKRGLTTGTREPGRTIDNGSGSATTSTLTHAKTYTAFGEVASETNARGYTTSFSYNTLGRLTQKVSPQVSTTAENGAITTTSTPTENYRYDLSGRLIGVQDANGNWTTRLLAVETGYGGADATVLKEFHADSSLTVVGIDAFGDARKFTDEAGNIETRDYDKLGRLITLTRPTRTSTSTTLVEHYVYDVLGQRVAHWNNQLWNAATSVGYKDVTDYDTAGRITYQALRYTASGGSATDSNAIATAYVWDGSIATSGMATFGGWTKTVTTYDYNTTTSAYRTLIDKQDYFGRVTNHADLGGRVYSYGFSKAGQLLSTTYLSTTIATYSYFNTGRMATAATTTTITGGTRAMSNGFLYDAEGNRTLETYTKDENGYHNVWDAESHSYVSEAYSDFSYVEQATGTWDALNRMTAYANTAMDGGSPVTMVLEYDAVGNVRRMASTFYYIGSGSTTTQDYWYKYDSMNRFVTTMGAFSGSRGSGTIARSTTGLDVTYYSNGQRATATSTVGGVTHLETYTYGEDGFLAKVKIQDGSGYNLTRAVDVRDAMGRVTSHTEYLADGSVSGGTETLGTVAFVRSGVTYDAAGNLTADSSTRLQAKSGGGYDTYVTATSYSFTGSTLTLATASNTVNGGSATTSTVAYTYGWMDGAKQATIVNTPNTASPGTYTTSTFYYDANGHLDWVDIADGNPRHIHYITDMLGQVVHRRQSATSDIYGTPNATPNAFYYYFNGQRIGDISNDGPSEYDYGTAISKRTAIPSANSWRNGSATNYANFDQSYDPINPTSQGEAGTGGSVAVKEGDTLQSIAAAVWGDASLWYLIADANGMNGTEELVTGTSLAIPAKVTNVHNSSATFRVYNPNEAIGDVQPGQPKPPGEKGCGLFGQLISVIIAVFVGRALGAIPGNIASQLFLMATGDQREFSWSQVATTVVTAGISKGLERLASGANAFSSFVNAASGGNSAVAQAIVGATANVLTQGIELATHMQKSFDWTGVAAAGVVSGASGFVGGHLPGSFSTASAYVISGMAGAIAGAATRSLMDGTDFGDNLIAVLPDVISSTVSELISGKVSFTQTLAQKKVGQRTILIADELNGLSKGVATAGENTLPTKLAASEVDFIRASSSPYIQLAQNDSIPGSPTTDGASASDASPTYWLTVGGVVAAADVEQVDQVDVIGDRKSYLRDDFKNGRLLNLPGDLFRDARALLRALGRDANQDGYYEGRFPGKKNTPAEDADINQKKADQNKRVEAQRPETDRQLASGAALVLASAATLGGAAEFAALIRLMRSAPPEGPRFGPASGGGQGAPSGGSATVATSPGAQATVAATAAAASARPRLPTGAAPRLPSSSASEQADPPPPIPPTPIPEQEQPNPVGGGYASGGAPATAPIATPIPAPEGAQIVGGGFGLDGVPTSAPIVTPIPDSSLTGPQIHANAANSLGQAVEDANNLVRVGKNRVRFQGIEVRAVRDLIHARDSTLKAMAERGFAGKTVDGESIVLHHHRQNPAGFIVELGASKHSIRNPNQHPYGNAKGKGLTAPERAAFSEWRVEYWKARALAELQRRVGNDR